MFISTVDLNLLLFVIISYASVLILWLFVKYVFMQSTLNHQFELNEL